MSGPAKASAIAYALWFVMLIVAAFRVGSIDRGRTPEAIRFVFAGTAVVGVFACWMATMAPVTVELAGGPAQCIGEPATAFAGGTGEVRAPECQTALIQGALTLGATAVAVVLGCALALAVLANVRARRAASAATPLPGTS
ncbi:hypothetical protein [Pengzhenrongella frigida]|uniref:Uncharacterized protein n=1 Tax=Pengzhenrongella frigida TaxID=1259133 RepID=A0A4Q5N3S0_9MICO|nr:hypothetical protein [Cellulomonas sp. HLT2-17]RYV51913.1 hypothetical protein EUA98_05800 [Cellulomonas sp. HLT2-17]